MAFGYNYGVYPAANNYCAPPMPDQLAQLRAAGYQQPMQIQTPMQTAQQPQTANNGINWVQGEEGARAYMVAPGNTVMLMDSDGSSFYLKSADASGMPQPLRIFDYIERTVAPKTSPQTPQAPGVDYVTREELNALAARVDAITTSTQEPAKTKKTVKEDAE